MEWSRPAEERSLDAARILDWHHAMELAVECGRVLLGEESPWLPLWQLHLRQQHPERCQLIGVEVEPRPQAW